MNKREPEQYIPDLEVAKYLKLVPFRYDMFHTINYPTPLSGYAVIVLQILYSIPIRFSHSFEILENKFTQDGVDYYKMSADFLLPHTRSYGICDRSRLSRLIKEILEFPTQLVISHTKYINNRRYRYFAFTKYTKEMFETEEYDVIKVAKEINKHDNTNDDPEAPDVTTNDIVSEFPEWFDTQWEVLKASGRFTSCNKCNPKTDVPYKYATDFAKGVEQLIDGTFYKGVGVWIKDKTIKIPEGLTVDSIIEAVLSVEGKLITNPLKALVLQTANMNYSPLLKYWEKNGAAGSSTRSQATSPTTKPAPKSTDKSVRSNVQYTAEDYKSNKTVMYTYDYIKSYLPNGMVDELIYGDISDYWLKEHPFAKKYDNRLTNFCMDIREAYKDAKKHRPNMSKVLNTLIDMAQFKTKGTDQKWENLFWEYIDQMPIYQDHGLWKWFVERFEHLYGESICDMYNRNKARELEMERASQLRAIEASAFGDYD